MAQQMVLEQIQQTAPEARTYIGRIRLAIENIKFLLRYKAGQTSDEKWRREMETISENWQDFLSRGNGNMCNTKRFDVQQNVLGKYLESLFSSANSDEKKKAKDNIHNLIQSMDKEIKFQCRGNWSKVLMRDMPWYDVIAETPQKMPIPTATQEQDEQILPLTEITSSTKLADSSARPLLKSGSARSSRGPSRTGSAHTVTQWTYYPPPGSGQAAQYEQHGGQFQQDGGQYGYPDPVQRGTFGRPARPGATYTNTPVYSSQGGPANTRITQYRQGPSQAQYESLAQKPIQGTRDLINFIRARRAAGEIGRPRNTGSNPSAGTPTTNAVRSSSGTSLPRSSSSTRQLYPAERTSGTTLSHVSAAQLGSYAHGPSYQGVQLNYDPTIPLPADSMTSDEIRQLQQQHLQHQLQDIQLQEQHLLQKQSLLQQQQQEILASTPVRGSQSGHQNWDQSPISSTSASASSSSTSLNKGSRQKSGGRKSSKKAAKANRKAKKATPDMSTNPFYATPDKSTNPFYGSTVSDRDLQPFETDEAKLDWKYNPLYQPIFNDSTSADRDPQPFETDEGKLNWSSNPLYNPIFNDSTKFDSGLGTQINIVAPSAENSLHASIHQDNQHLGVPAISSSSVTLPNMTGAPIDYFPYQQEPYATNPFLTRIGGNEYAVPTRGHQTSPRQTMNRQPTGASNTYFDRVQYADPHTGEARRPLRTDIEDRGTFFLPVYPDLGETEPVKKSSKTDLKKKKSKSYQPIVPVGGVVDTRGTEKTPAYLMGNEAEMDGAEKTTTMWSQQKPISSVAPSRPGLRIQLLDKGRTHPIEASVPVAQASAIGNESSFVDYKGAFYRPDGSIPRYNPLANEYMKPERRETRYVPYDHIREDFRPNPGSVIYEGPSFQIRSGDSVTLPTYFFPRNITQQDYDMDVKHASAVATSYNEHSQDMAFIDETTQGQGFFVPIENVLRNAIVIRT